MAFDIETDYPTVGGRLVATGAGDGYLDFGWIPPERRSPEQEEADHNAVSAMPAFSIEGSTKYPEEKKACLFDFWKHPEVVTALGFEYPGTHQLTGSCVGAGGGNAHASLIFVECVRLRDPEQIILPFWLLTYGRSRYHCGMRGRGEGSLGSCYAKAAIEDGILPQNLPELPKPNNSDALVWGSSVEMEWSAGDREPCTKWLEKSRKHIVKSAAKLSSADHVREALVNGYPVTIASMYAFRANVQDGVLLGVKSGSWSHQMSLQGWWEHPTHGEIFYDMNQWGKGAHGTSPCGAPPGGAWIKKDDVDWICRTGEVYAFSQFQGFPAQVVPWPDRYI